MAGRAKTRARINATLAQAGAEPLAPGVPIPDPVLQAQALATAKLRRERKTLRQREKRDRERLLQQAPGPAVPAPVPIEDQIRAVLTGVLNDARAPALARIQSAKQLLEMSGTAPQYMKYTIDVRLSAYAENQYEADMAAHRARVAQQQVPR